MMTTGVNQIDHSGIEPIPFNKNQTQGWAESENHIFQSYQMSQETQYNGSVSALPNLNEQLNYMPSLQNQQGEQQLYSLSQPYSLQQQYGQVSGQLNPNLEVTAYPSQQIHVASNDAKSLDREIQQVSEIIDQVPDVVNSLQALKDNKINYAGMNYSLGYQSPSAVEIPIGTGVAQASGQTQPKAKRSGRKQCSFEGCNKRARTRGLCISHGGGKRCSVDGCMKSSQSRGLCIKHGGGKRCEVEGCSKGAQTKGRCKMHGGGRRCTSPGCGLSAQGGQFCRKHGGGQRCAVEGCTKGTQHGKFCGAHGGFRVCKIEGCERHDRGGGLCARHGGGKRCEHEGCNRPSRSRGLCTHHSKVL